MPDRNTQIQYTLPNHDSKLEFSLIYVSAKNITMLQRNILKLPMASRQIMRFHTKVAKSVQPARTGRIGRYFFGISVASAVAITVYDSTNQFEYIGGASRFLRSLKIAAVISADYSWSLFGVDNSTEEYGKVRDV